MAVKRNALYVNIVYIILNKGILCEIVFEWVCLYTLYLYILWPLGLEIPFHVFFIALLGIYSYMHIFSIFYNFFISPGASIIEPSSPQGDIGVSIL